MLQDVLLRLLRVHRGDLGDVPGELLRRVLRLLRLRVQQRMRRVLRLLWLRVQRERGGM